MCVALGKLCVKPLESSIQKQMTMTYILYNIFQCFNDVLLRLVFETMNAETEHALTKLSKATDCSFFNRVSVYIINMQQQRLSWQEVEVKVVSWCYYK